MATTSGRAVFTSYEGVEYLIGKYLKPNDIEELRKLNDGFHDEEYKEQLVTRLSTRSGGRSFIPGSYEAELMENSKALVGSRIKAKKLKTKKENVTVITTYENKQIYQDRKGRWRQYGTGKYTKTPR
jgi:hypothetical protein